MLRFWKLFPCFVFTPSSFNLTVIAKIERPSFTFSRFWIIFTIIILYSFFRQSPYLLLFCLDLWAFIMFLFWLNISLPFHLIQITVFGVAFCMLPIYFKCQTTIGWLILSSAATSCIVVSRSVLMIVLGWLSTSYGQSLHSSPQGAHLCKT